MLQYVINASAIWLICLLCYEVLFRRESFYQYNRLFLLFSLAAGLLLPALSLNKIVSAVPQNNKGVVAPVTQVYELKKRIAVASVPKVNKSQHLMTTPQPEDRTELILWSVYFAGTLVSLLWLIKEALYLYRLYRRGSRSYQQGYTLVETREAHGPFSFFRIIFVGSRQDYTDTEWRFILTHELEHKCRLHSFDNLFLIAVRLVFWFHPLPHMYFKRLRMVHEFQADKAAGTEIEQYGTFLLEQTLLQSTLVLTHSFNYSPIKIRIAMLTKIRSSRARLLKYFIVFPLTLLLVFCCTQISLSGEVTRQGNKVYFKGNEITMGQLKVIPYSYQEEIENQKKIFRHASLPDSVLSWDYRTNHMKMEQVVSDVMPVDINGKHIYGNEPKYLLTNAEVDYTAPVFGKFSELGEYLFSEVQSDLNKLDDGFYTFNVNRVVIDDQGRIAYYEDKGISQFREPYEKGPMMSQALKNVIDKKIEAALNTNQKFAPAVKDGKAINARVAVRSYDIVVKQHKAILMKGGGC
jgi:beta-lactamase regulating signal transducer with metallopeptidase domain